MPNTTKESLERMVKEDLADPKAVAIRGRGGDALDHAIARWVSDSLCAFARRKQLAARNLDLQEYWAKNSRWDLRLTVSLDKSTARWKVLVETVCGTTTRPQVLMLQLIDVGGQRQRHVYNRVGDIGVYVFGDASKDYVSIEPRESVDCGM